MTEFQIVGYAITAAFFAAVLAALILAIEDALYRRRCARSWERAEREGWWQ